MLRARMAAMSRRYKEGRRFVRRSIMYPAFGLAFWRYRTNIAQRAWGTILSNLEHLAAKAERAGDYQFLRELSFAALRLGRRRLSVELYHKARVLDGTKLITDWRGEDLTDSTLVIRVMETASQGVAGGVALCGYIQAAAQKAKLTIVIVEKRLVTLFQRTLPETTVVAYGTDTTNLLRGKLVTATTNDLEFVLHRGAQHLHLPLAVDNESAAELRHKYKRGRSIPLIGLSWWSSHQGKELPSLDCWRRLVTEVPAQFVSLQYGDVSNATSHLDSARPGAILVDKTVDQMTDFDRFASQIAALDLVITISNTGAHLTGAIGIPMILVRDDLFRRNWPYLSRHPDWYPETTVIGKEGRTWNDTFTEIISLASSRFRQN